jgi:hypothetical protein
MNAIDHIKMSLEMSKGWVMGLAADAESVAMTAPTPNGGNHPLWCVGHLAFAEGNLVHKYIKGEANPLAEWEELFGRGSTPIDDASKYPSFQELMGKFEAVRADTMALLDTLTDADLDKPTHVEGEMAEFFGTVGKCLAVIPIHCGFHGGQIADARRAAGKPPLMG